MLQVTSLAIPPDSVGGLINADNDKIFGDGIASAGTGGKNKNLTKTKIIE